jgi:hypothetical protein
MDKVILSTEPEVIQEQATYAPPAVVYEAPLEIRAGTPFPKMPDPLNLFGTNEK